MPAGRSVEDAIAAVRERIDPDQAERAALAAAVEALIERTEAALEGFDVEADVMQVGSTARGTWVSGDRDIDVFVRFDPDLDRETLTDVGLQVGNIVLPEGREEFAEHPYVHGEWDGFEVDLVPCYRVEEATAIQSAVDRTPFHNAYLDENIDANLAEEVRLCKQFLKGIGVYGSDLRTQGYSGYLVELLVLEYGSFEGVLPQVHLDPVDHAAAEFDHPLVVIDPTDPERNVAAVVSEGNVARLVHHARRFLDDPDPEVFFPADVEPIDAAAVAAEVRTRQTTPIAVRFDPPDVVDDQLYPQLRRSLAGLERGLETAGFQVLRSATWAEETAVLLVELSVATLPAIERHDGPPVHVREHAERFFETYEDSDVYGPFIDEGRYVVEREREITSAAKFVEDELLSVALGAHIETVLSNDGYEVLEGVEIEALVPEFGEQLARYFQPEV